jgi:hypothetical protein
MYDNEQPYHLPDEDVLGDHHIPTADERTQERKIFEKLWMNESVSAFELSRWILQYNARIHGLRTKYGLDIECFGPKDRTRYRLLTPKSNIDYNTMKLKPVEPGKNLSLF